jgi:hypothetical protein
MGEFTFVTSSFQKLEPDKQFLGTGTSNFFWILYVCFW